MELNGDGDGELVDDGTSSGIGIGNISFPLFTLLEHNGDRLITLIGVDDAKPKSKSIPMLKLLESKRKSNWVGRKSVGLFALLDVSPSLVTKFI